ncbi:hypothetical protein GLAREA_04233 [Glarea lozoyensis ATCC 20868]|uniref:Heterokaryon incompatibility domain-containing protein n=1 Tax=Glarea lozoyensis (strain ATCC 20868 / MF5171) TaxID=1116229 RepID=S3CLS0_GLAL2|nr:uncharacterized protein GLAREA_04233 [Glarea lozoyensis ATCC 20868]EPE27442.1 hypothetical protein GLAREA_04233 [Glarea lozoyensis ATCC 20868]
MKLWVDALCIDQSNIAERSHQVLLMETVYKKAFAVVTWLGEEGDDSDAAIGFILAICRRASRGQKLKHLGLSPIEISSEYKSDFLNLPWKALFKFLSRRYWRRLWIVQELALNHHMTLFMCGKSQISRSMIIRTCKSWRDPRGSTYGSLWPTVWHVDILLRTTQEWKDTGLASILDLSRDATTGDILHIRGIIFDWVSSMSASLSEKDVSRAATQDLAAPRETSNNFHVYGDKLSEALERTLMMNHPSNRAKDVSIFEIYWADISTFGDDLGAYQNTHSSFRKAMQAVLSTYRWELFNGFRNINAEYLVFGRKFRDFFPPNFRESYPGPDLTTGHAREMLISSIALVGRRIIATKGGYIGLLPEQVQIGDVIAILFGCSFPVVLRPSGHQYIYIGECYIDGIMDGEILEQKNSIQYKEVDIEIC